MIELKVGDIFVISTAFGSLICLASSIDDDYIHYCCCGYYGRELSVFEDDNFAKMHKYIPNKLVRNAYDGEKQWLLDAIKSKSYYFDETEHRLKRLNTRRFKLTIIIGIDKCITEGKTNEELMHEVSNKVNSLYLGSNGVYIESNAIEDISVTKG